MEYMLTFHILNVYVDNTQPHQFKFTFKQKKILTNIKVESQAFAWSNGRLPAKPCVDRYNSCIIQVILK